jgi:hypothetical protein
LSWYQNNKESQQQKNRERYALDPERERAYRRESYHKNKNKPEKVKYGLWKHAKHRAVSKGLPFDITLDDIVIPDVCPIMKQPITGVGSGSYAASIDRIIPELGYVKDNIRVISLLANQMKWNASPEELESFCRGMLMDLGK